MEFINPTALFGLLALPLLLIPYLVRKKPHRVVFSSILLFIESGAAVSSRPFGRIHLPPIFFLQLLLLTLLVLSLSEPVFSVRPTKVAVVLDNSASMQAIDDGRTRFAIAREKLGATVGELAPSAEIDLYLTTPRMIKVTRAPVAARQALETVATLNTYDLGDAPIDYDQVLGQLAREHKYDRVYLFTDHPIGGGQGSLIKAVSVGRPAANLAVTSFDVQRTSLLNARMQAVVTVANFSAKEEKTRVLLKAEGATLASRDLAVPADKTATAIFEGFAERPSYAAEIETRDALALDNRRFAVVPPARNLRVLAVTPRPQAAASLKSIQGVSVDVVAPADYGKLERAGYGLEIFHYSTPAQLPETPTLFILPPESIPLVDLGAPVSNVQVSGWREPHGLTRYVNFALFRPTYARPLRPQAAGKVILESPMGPLAFAVEQRGIRYLTLGFDPLPYLGRENLPMSIFTLNFLDWFFEGAGGTRSQATGEPIPLGSVEQGDSLSTPAGETVSLKSGLGYFPDTFHQGLYRRTRQGSPELFARNLENLGESDLRAPTTIELRAEAASGASASVLFSFWPYLLLASLALLALEWFIFPRRPAPRLAPAGGRTTWRDGTARS